jgi:hypothetical protein
MGSKIYIYHCHLSDTKKNSDNYLLLETEQNNEIINFIFMGPCIVGYRGGIYDQGDATDSQYLLLEMLYMFRAIIAHHQELETVL